MCYLSFITMNYFLRPFGFNEFDGAGGAGYAMKFASLFDGIVIIISVLCILNPCPDYVLLSLLFKLTKMLL